MYVNTFYTTCVRTYTCVCTAFTYIYIYIYIYTHTHTLHSSDDNVLLPQFKSTLIYIETYSQGTHTPVPHTYVLTMCTHITGSASHNKNYFLYLCVNVYLVFSKKVLSYWPWLKQSLALESHDVSSGNVIYDGSLFKWCVIKIYSLSTDALRPRMNKPFESLCVKFGWALSNDEPLVCLVFGYVCSSKNHLWLCHVGSFFSKAL